MQANRAGTRLWKLLRSGIRQKGRRGWGTDREPTFPNRVKTINLALQGGGAHGAFTWGVLDRLLEEETLAFEGISATSAGAMNAAVVAYGLTVGGREGARKALTNYWRRISHAAQSSPLQPSPIDRMLKDHSLRWSPAFLLRHHLTRLMSPYEFNPMNLNPLRDVVEQSVDFDVLNKPDCPIKLFLSATNVRTGKVKIFAAQRAWRRRRSPRRACPSCSRRSRSTARPIGTAATWAIRRSFR